MSFYRRWYLAIFTAFWLVLMAVIWMFLAPIQAGGQAAYVVIVGNSMEPDFHIGDLVILHQAAEYKPGDIVAYRNLELGNNVFHRIIGAEHGLYTFKGDNNSWTDSYQPTRGDLIGKLWVYIPRGGIVLQRLRLPINMAILAGILGSILAIAMIKGNHKGGRNMEKKSLQVKWNSLIKTLGSKLTYLRQRLPLQSSGQQHAIIKTDDIHPPAVAKSQDFGKWGSLTEGSLFTLGLIAFASLILGILSFTRPSTRVVPDDTSFQHLGFFTYTATAPAGVYDSDTVHSGEPIFPKLTCSADVGFNYTLLAEQLESAGGAYQLTAILADPLSGWQRILPLQEKKTFSGNTFDTHAELNLCQVTSLIDSVEQETDFRPGYYTLSITPQIELVGVLAGKDLQTAFGPELVFKYDRNHFSLMRDDPDVNPLTPSETGFLKEERKEANTLSIFGLEAKVPLMRLVSLVGLSLSITGMVVLGMRIQRLAHKDQKAFVRMKYDPMVVDVQGRGLDTTSRVIDIGTIDDLAKLADRYNAMILHEVQGQNHNYMVQGKGVVYLYSLAGTSRESMNGAWVQLSTDMKRGLEQGEFQVYYQPIVSLKDNTITAVEALLRWQHPQRGLISASEFIQAAEATGLITQLDEWVLQVACKQLSAWHDAGKGIKLAVNLSDRDLGGGYTRMIRQVLDTSGINPNSLQIEIPESRLLEQAYKYIPDLQELNALGINITIDDFMGQSAISSLGQLPINSVKMNRVFIEQLNQPDQAASLQRMFALFTNMGFDMVAKGVETEEQKSYLNTQDFPQAQGFLLGRPTPAKDILEILQEHNPLKGSKPSKKRSGPVKDRK